MAATFLHQKACGYVYFLPVYLLADRAEFVLCGLANTKQAAWVGFGKQWARVWFGKHPITFLTKSNCLTA